MGKFRVRLWLLRDDLCRLWPEKLYTWFIWKLPKRMIYWSVVRAAVKDEPGNPSEVTALTMLERFK